MLVRDPEPSTKLTALLEIYEIPTRRLLDAVMERLAGITDLAVPLDQTEHGVRDLLIELAVGHLRIANKQLLAGKPATTEQLCRALELLDTAHLIEQLHYCPPAAGLWQLVLAVYLYAESQGLGDETSKSSAPPSGGAPITIRALFFRALVIGLCDPHQRRPGDVRAWHAWTGPHADTLELAVLPQGAYSIPIDTSGALPPLTAARRGKPGPDMRYLASEAFLDLLSVDSDAPAGLHEALTALIKGRKSAEQRNSTRQPRNHPFRLSSGLGKVHGRLSDLTAGSNAAAEQQPGSDCRQINQSNTGAAFVLHPPLNSPLAIGEVILAETNNTASGGAAVGFVGRVQRLVTHDDGQMEIGVEKLGGRLIPIEISGGATEQARGLTRALLQQKPESGQYALLAARGLFREGDTVNAESLNARYKVRMRKLQPGSNRVAYIDVELVD